MTVTTITTTNFLSDVTLLIRDDLRTNITDPISGTRGTNQKFVMTSYPERTATYPIITVQNINIVAPARLGMQSEIHQALLPLEIRAWARNVKERDTLTQLIINRLRDNTINKFNPANLYDFNIKSAVNVDEPGDAGIHSKVITVEFKFLLGST